MFVCAEQAWDMILPESGGSTFVNAAANPAFKPPSDTDTSGVDERQPHLLTTGMGGQRHMERLSRLRALKKRRE